MGVALFIKMKQALKRNFVDVIDWSNIDNAFKFQMNAVKNLISPG